MNYVLACLTSVQSGAKEIIIKARGRAISKAVDVAEICRNRFMKDQLTLKKIEIGTQDIQSRDRGTFSVSTIEITLDFK
ncbi:MAG: DNA-binding protein Alba [Candidatus Helarchaeota archaeon]|nr:DNA-binding protein Alba [Candidatus Helarchaeota archaeon]